MSRDLEQLLRVGVAAARNGNTPAARALFRALTREHPDEPRAWLGMAGCAESRAEQRHALQQVLRLNPEHAQARQALARIGPSAPPPAAPAITSPLPVADPAPAALGDQPPLPEPAAASAADLHEGPERPRPPASQSAPPAAVVIAPPPAEPTEPAPGRFPLLNIIGIGVMILLLAAIGWLIGTTIQGTGQDGAPPSATPALVPDAPTAPAGASTGAPPPPSAAPATRPPAATQPAGATSGPQPTGSAAQPTTAAADATLPLGTILSYDGWQAVLLQPDYSLFLDGSIGDLRPNGRFILALLAISNDTAAPRRIPSDLFVLSDSRGRRYLPVPGASTAYLSVCGRGLCGDLALEDTLDAGSGMRTVPLIFDVPPGAAGLSLTLSSLSTAGWPISDAPPQESPAGP